MKNTLSLSEKLALITKPVRIIRRQLSNSEITKANRFYKQAGDITGVYIEVKNED